MPTHRPIIVSSRVKHLKLWPLFQERRGEGKAPVWNDSFYPCGWSFLMQVQYYLGIFDINCRLFRSFQFFLQIKRISEGKYMIIYSKVFSLSYQQYKFSIHTSPCQFYILQFQIHIFMSQISSSKILPDLFQIFEHYHLDIIQS